MTDNHLHCKRFVLTTVTEQNGEKTSLNKHCKLGGELKATKLKDSDVQYENPRHVHPALRPYLGYCLNKLATIFKGELCSAFKTKNIQGVHFGILAIIENSKNTVNQVSICDETGIDKASMVKIIDHLESLNYIERVASKEDRRIKNLSLTKSGAKFLKDSIVIRNKIEADFLVALDVKQIKQFKLLILKVLDHQK